MTTWHLITGEYPPQAGGVSDYSRQLARGLTDAGDRVEVWAPPSGREGSACGHAGAPSAAAALGWRAEPRTSKSEATRQRKFALGVGPQRQCKEDGQDGRENCSDTGITVHRLPDRFGVRSLWHLDRALGRFPAPRRILVQYVPHAFGAKGANIPFCLWLRSRRSDSTWVMFHEVMFFANGDRRLTRQALAVANRMMATLVAGAAERAFVSIPGWRPLLEPLLPAHTGITWLPVPSAIPVVTDPAATGAIRSRYAPGRPLVGHFGTYGSAIGMLLDRTLPPLAVLSDCHVLLLGYKSDAACRALISAHPSLAGRLFATGPLAAGDVSHHVAACDLMLQPYPDGVSTRRTSAMVALSHGRPLVTTAGWLTEEMWQEAGAAVLAPVDEPDTLAAAAAKLLCDVSRREEVGRRAAALYDARFHIRHSVSALRAKNGG